MTVAANTSRNEQSRRIDEWLRRHSRRVQVETPNELALELRRAGFYSPKTTLVDIRGGLRKRCARLGLPFCDQTTTHETA